MKILVICGAGASSTFVAGRVRKAAEAVGRVVDARAGTLATVAPGVADVILLGPHLASAREEVSRALEGSDSVVVQLPPDVFTDLDGTRTLSLVDAAVTATPRKELLVSERTIRIGSANGLHARPAKLFAQAVKDGGLPVTIAKGSAAPVNAASILGVIALGAEKGDYVTLAAEGDGAEALLDHLAELLTTDHDEN